MATHDRIRGIMQLSVVAFHLYEYLRVKSGIPPLGVIGTALHHGLRGVPLFFAISGFILGRPFAQHYIRGAEPPRLKSYFLRRLTRLEPPYIISMLVFFALLALSGRHETAHLLASLAYVHNLIYAAPSTISSVAWSLEVEVQFYCLIPLIGVLYKAPRMVRRTVLLTAMLAGVIHLFAIPDRLHLSILGWVQCFAAGLLLADLHTDDWNPEQHWGFDLLSLALWPAIFLLNDQLTWILMPLMSFALYVAALITISVSLVALTLTSLAFFITIERPCMDKNWPHKVWQFFRSKLRRVDAPSPAAAKQP